MIYLAINTDKAAGMWTHIEAIAEFTSPLGAAQFVVDGELEPADYKVLREIDITEELKMAITENQKGSGERVATRLSPDTPPSIKTPIKDHG